MLKEQREGIEKRLAAAQKQQTDAAAKEATAKEHIEKTEPESAAASAALEDLQAQRHAMGFEGDLNLAGRERARLGSHPRMIETDSWRGSTPRGGEGSLLGTTPTTPCTTYSTRSSTYSTLASG